MHPDPVRDPPTTSPSSTLLVASFPSFDALFWALYRGEIPIDERGGFVRAHHDMLRDASAPAVLALRERLGTSGLTLLLTTLASPAELEVLARRTLGGHDLPVS